MDNRIVSPVLQGFIKTEQEVAAARCSDAVTALMYQRVSAVVKTLVDSVTEDFTDHRLKLSYQRNENALDTDELGRLVIMDVFREQRLCSIAYTGWGERFIRNLLLDTNTDWESAKCLTPEASEVSKYLKSFAVRESTPTELVQGFFEYLRDTQQYQLITNICDTRTSPMMLTYGFVTATVQSNVALDRQGPLSRSSWRFRISETATEELGRFLAHCLVHKPPVLQPHSPAVSDSLSQNAKNGA